MKGYTYPRSLSEAFNDAGRACAVHGPYRGDSTGWVVSVWASCAIGVALVLALITGAI